MVVDSSALIAMLREEPDHGELLMKLDAAPQATISAGTLVEAGVVAEGLGGEPLGRELDLLLHRADVVTVPVDAEQVLIARAAWRRYGKGRHPAGLNLGDLFAYALARATGEPLLFKGADFAATDLAAA